MEATLKGSRERLKRGSPDDEATAKVRAAARALYTEILLEDTAFAVAKAIEQRLWAVDYKLIEECQGLLREANKRPGGLGSESAQLEVEACRLVLSGELQRASQHYYGVVQALVAKHEVQLNVPVPNKGPSVPASKVCQRYMVTLGDLGRYWQLYCVKTPERKWGDAVAYYSRALMLQPNDGKVHNQLAVLASYTSDEFGSAYRYCRALSTAMPFSAKENLNGLFESNRKRLSDIDRGHLNNTTV